MGFENEERLAREIWTLCPSLFASRPAIHTSFGATFDFNATTKPNISLCEVGEVNFDNLT